MPGCIICGHNFYIKYIDDTVLMADAETNLQNLPNKVVNEKKELISGGHRYTYTNVDIITR